MIGQHNSRQQHPAAPATFRPPSFAPALTQEGCDLLNRNSREFKIAVSPSPSTNVSVLTATKTRCAGFAGSNAPSKWMGSRLLRRLTAKSTFLNLAQASGCEVRENSVSADRLGRRSLRADGAPRTMHHLLLPILIADPRLEFGLSARKINHLKISNRLKTTPLGLRRARSEPALRRGIRRCACAMHCGHAKIRASSSSAIVRLGGTFQ